VSNHFSAANLKFPGDDARLDLTDLFVFPAPEDDDKTVFIIDVNPFMTGSDFYPGGEVLIESTPVGFDATAEAVQAGPCRLFIGVRSDPFFADAEGALHGFQWTGQDTFAGKNILSIAFEVPNAMLGADPLIGVWATISLCRDGKLFQMDRGGHPTINPFINPDSAKDDYNLRQPADDVANYLQPWSK